MKVIGIEDVNFTSADGTKEVKGIRIHVAQPLQHGVGESGDKFFLSEAKLSKMGFKLAVGQVITPLYNRWGKVETLVLENEGGDAVIDY